MRTHGGHRLSDNRFRHVFWLVLLAVVTTAFVALSACAIQGSMLGPNEEAATTEAATPEPEPEPVTITQQTTYLEYSDKTTDPLKLIECSDTTVQITCDPEELQLDEVGEVTVTYHLVRGEQSSDVDLVFEVRDTKRPMILIRESVPTVEQGATFDPAANISRVYDPVDGDLQRVDVEPTPLAEEGRIYDEGWYLVSSNVNTATPGRFDVTVLACDIYGNRYERTYQVSVVEPPTPAPAPTPAPESEPEPAAPAARVNHYVLNTNTMVFHHPGCYSAKQIAEYNRQDVEMTRDEIIAMGYRPCGHCDP